MKEYKWPLMKDTITLGDRINLAKHCLLGDRFTQGEKVKEFEKKWSDWIGAKHSVFVNSGSSANLLMLSAVKEIYNIPNGSKVLVPATTWATSVAPIIQLGLEPVFVDVSLKNFGMDIEAVSNAVMLHGKKIKIVFNCHLLGFTDPSTEDIQEILSDAIYLNDVCESYGCKNKSLDKVGSAGIGSSFSFYYGHHMSTIEGGMITTEDSEMYDMLLMKRSHGLTRETNRRYIYEEKYPNIDNRFLFYTDGFNLRNTELAAILGISQLKRLDKFIQIRNRNYQKFSDLLKNHCYSFYHIPYEDNMSSFCFPLICKSHSYVIKLQMLLDKYGIESRPVIGGNLTKHPFLKGYSVFSSQTTLNADIIHHNGLYIGNNHFVTLNDLDKLESIMKEVNRG